MRLSIIFTLLILAITSASAQNIVNSLRQDVAGQGKVTIHQDERLDARLNNSHLTVQVGTDLSDSEEGTPAMTVKTIKANGYRVQVYAGNNSRAARNEATQIGSKVRDAFPDLKVYTYFVSPRWLCRVGDFRSIEEADVTLRQLKASGVFREVAIVKDHINIPIN